jgi:protein-S-isoprenylcysteine O-methyltransferase Ste14
LEAIPWFGARDQPVSTLLSGPFCLERQFESERGTITSLSMNVAHKSWWQIFEVVFGIPFLVAVGLQLAVPLSLPRGFLAPAIVSGGATLIIVGVVLAVPARRELARHGQPTDPGLPTGKIVATGIFAVSRNPLYLGGICFLVGIALALNFPWVLVLLVPAIVACHYILIAPEEKYLAAKFGEEYRMYAAKVHRWVGRKRISH